MDRFDDGHVLLLSDLLLMCRLKTREEMDQNPEGNFSSFWLLFPPLAVRHVFANDVTQDARGKFYILVETIDAEQQHPPSDGQ